MCTSKGFRQGIELPLRETLHGVCRNWFREYIIIIIIIIINVKFLCFN
jgi:hypothetical protein